MVFKTENRVHLDPSSLVLTFIIIWLFITFIRSFVFTFVRRSIICLRCLCNMTFHSHSFSIPRFNSRIIFLTQQSIFEIRKVEVQTILLFLLFYIVAHRSYQGTCFFFHKSSITYLITYLMSYLFNHIFILKKVTLLFKKHRYFSSTLETKVYTGDIFRWVGTR